jgi:tRNA(Ile)-lysidine synthase
MAASRKKSDSLKDAARTILARHLERGSRVRLGLSGGLDSIVLLSVLSQLRDDYPLSALHVHHGLSAQADEWARFCEQTCAQMDVPIETVRLILPTRMPEGVEAAARAARYAALIRPGADAVITAHHADDQVETVLFQLLRGGGPRALAAMPEIRELSPNLPLLRPLLAFTRAELETYARLHGLLWVEDESNADPRYSRNALRHELLPALARFIPDYRERLLGSAQRMAEAAQLLDALAALDGAAAGLPNSITSTGLAALPEARARNLLAYYLRLHGAPLPSPAHLAEMLRQLKEARTRLVLSLPDGRVLVRLKGRIQIDRAKNDGEP